MRKKNIKLQRKQDVPQRTKLGKKVKKSQLRYNRKNKTSYIASKEVTRLGKNEIDRKIEKVENDNLGIKSVHGIEKTTTNTISNVDRYQTIRRKFQIRKQKRVDKQLNRTSSQVGTKSGSTSKQVQKTSLKKKYNVQSYNKNLKLKSSKSASNIAKKSIEKLEKMLVSIIKNPKIILMAGALLLVMAILSTVLTSCSLVFQGTVTNTVSTSFTTDDEELLEVERMYNVLEDTLESQINSIEDDYPDYDEYNYEIAMIGHDPHELASYLTVLFQTYYSDVIGDTLNEIFQQQYELVLTEVIEVRTRIEIVDEEEVEVEYEYKILNVSLQNKSISEIAQNNFSVADLSLFNTYLEMSGNKPYVFGGGTNDTSTSTDLTGVVFVDGERVGNQSIVDIAMSQIGNAGGQPYWSWYGFNSRVAWCATFVSWCINQAGYSSPKFASCHNQGLPYFVNNGRWADSSYRDMTAGDVVFFDWNGDGRSDHVGFVVGKDATKLYTVEGNTGDKVAVRNYALNSSSIMGYGLMN